MTDVELAWLTGLFEGEGCINVRKGRNMLVLSLQMTDEDIVRRCLTISRLGNVTGPHVWRGRPTHKPCWRWHVSKCDDAARLLALMLPLLGQRRRHKAIEALKSWEQRLTQNPPNRLKTHCKNGHVLTAANIRIRTRKSGGRQCVACDRQRYQQHKKDTTQWQRLS